MNWLNTLFRQTRFPGIFLLLLGYFIYRVLANDTNTLKTKALFIVLILFLPVYGQHKGISFEYSQKLAVYLYPKVTNEASKELLLFCEEPSFGSPEQSLRIIDTGKQSFLEARVLNTNLWLALISAHKTDTSKMKTVCYTAPVSAGFRSRMLALFVKLTAEHLNKVGIPKTTHTTSGYVNGNLLGVDNVEGPDIFDGTSYKYRIQYPGLSSDITISRTLDTSDLRSKVSKLNIGIINDLTHHTFKESNYDQTIFK